MSAIVPHCESTSPARKPLPTPTTKPSRVAQSVAHSCTKRLPDFSTAPWSPAVVASSQNLAAMRDGALMKNGSKIGAQRMTPGICATHCQIASTATISASRATTMPRPVLMPRSGTRDASAAPAARPAA